MPTNGLIGRYVREHAKLLDIRKAWPQTSDSPATVLSLRKHR